ncbi:hypothetical protein NXV62_22690 [Bacteroides fragilis]|nr:hypothetical protein [Bacteroides fragilis]
MEDIEKENIQQIFFTKIEERANSQQLEILSEIYTCKIEILSEE